MESLIEFTDAVITTAEEEALYFPPLPELSKGKRYDPDEHLARRHLPGQHNQKTHGHDGGAGGYTPGAWKAENVDRDKRVAELAADFDKNTTGWLRERAEAVDGPDWARKAAEQIVGDETTGTVYRNGEHSVAFESTKVPAAQQRQFLAEVDSLQTTAPVDQINIRIQDSTKFLPGVGGETLTGTGNMRLNEELFAYAANNQTFLPGGTPMPMARKVVATEYVLAHEWGHAVDNQSEHGADIDPDIDLSVSMSTYGWRGGSYEAYAEAFAEWSLSGGQTNNQAAQTYAKAYGWGERWPSLATTSKAA